MKEEVATVEIQWAFDEHVTDEYKRHTSKEKVSKYIADVYGIKIDETNWTRVMNIVRNHRRMKSQLMHISADKKLSNFKDGTDESWRMSK